MSAVPIAERAPRESVLSRVWAFVRHHVLTVYAVLAFGLIAGWPPPLLWAMTLPAVAMSAFLGYSLIVNRRECRICWTGHVSNGLLFLLLAARALA